MGFKTAIAPSYIFFRHRLSRTQSTQIGPVKFKYPRYESGQIIGNLNAEIRLIERFLDQVRDTDIVYDIGADRGIYSVPLGLLCKELVAFEPHPISFHRLRHIHALNSVPAQIENCGLGKYGSRMRAEGYKLVQDDSGPVRIVTGDSYVSKYGEAPDVMKIDVEGMEMDVIRGFERTLSDSPPRMMLVELHPEEYLPSTYGLSIEEMKQLKSYIQGLGFEIQDLSSLVGGERSSGQEFIMAQQ